jgi:hypothetical protein
MASTYSTSLGLELIGQGEQSGTWGITTNNNFGTLVEQAITGVQAITMSNATYTMTTFQGASDESRNAVLVLGGTNLAPQNLIAPGVEKIYLIKNSTGSTITIKTATGNGVPITNNNYAQVYCDGTDFYNATPNVNTITGNLSVSGNGSFGGNVGIGGNLNVTGTVNAGAVTGVTGRIVQMVTATSGTAYTTSSSYTSTGMSATITPASATSKILVLCGALLQQTNVYASGGIASVALFRNGSNIVGGSDWQMVASGSGSLYCSFSLNYLDSPATTSATTYAIYMAAQNSGNLVFNSNGNAGQLILMEIL